jgi:hypothetical protein
VPVTVGYLNRNRAFGWGGRTGRSCPILLKKSSLEKFGLF